MIKNKISSIRLLNDSISSDPYQINKSFTEFYTNLYESKGDDNPEPLEKFFNNVKLPFLTEDEKQT